ncbi:AAA family ATPase [Erysipelotrichaceae bacterium 66-17]
MANLDKIEQYNQGNIYPETYEETYLATKHIKNEKLVIPTDVFERLKEAILERDLYFGEEAVLRDIVSGLIKGNIILQGPPGTGKTTLAKLLCQVFDVGYTEATANSEWTTYDSIGGLQPTANEEGQEVIVGKNGYVVSSIVKCCDTIVEYKEKNKEGLQGNWLIIDEINRCEIDKVFGDLFTALGSDSLDTERVINLWYQKDENKQKIYIPNRFRIIGAMNNVDKNYVNDISQGLSRRFTFIDILPPEEDVFSEEVNNAKSIAKKRVKEKIGNFGTQEITIEYLKQLDNLNGMETVEDILLSFIKHIRYDHENDDSYLGLQIGTAQIIDLYENIYISLIISNIRKDTENSEKLLFEIADNTLNGRIIPQIDGYDYNKLSVFSDAIKKKDKFLNFKKTIATLEKMVH